MKASSAAGAVNHRLLRLEGTSWVLPIALSLVAGLRIHKRNNFPFRSAVNQWDYEVLNKSNPCHKNQANFQLFCVISLGAKSMNLY